MRYICRSLGCKREFEKASHRNQHEKDAHKSEPAQVSQHVANNLLAQLLDSVEGNCYMGKEWELDTCKSLRKISPLDYEALKAENEAFKNTIEALRHAYKSEPAQVSQEPIAVMWQHEETGNTGFVDMFQVENGFFKNNLRLKQVCFCYSSSPDYEALHELFQTAVADFHVVKAENEALKAEVQHWKSNHANVVSRLAIAAQRPDLPVDRIPAIKENEALKLRVAELEKEIKLIDDYSK